MRHNLAILTLVLMVLLPSLLMVKALHDRGNGLVWQVDMTGYDPRDLLRGHYLNFRYDWDIVDVDSSEHCIAGQACCLCLTERAPNDFTNPQVRAVDCRNESIARQCTSRLKNMNAMMGPQIYYVPEDHALRLEKMLRDGGHDFKMEIAVPRSGGPAMIRDLYVDQKPLASFLTQPD
jgi:uncharacterized membrane-anchored protein